jgi:ppGpp synthetase/RelA/SpoT-type nucleotidyltranferase
VKIKPVERARRSNNCPTMFQTRLDHPKTTLADILVGAEQVVRRLRTLSDSAGPNLISSQFYTRARSKTLKSVQSKIYLKRTSGDASRLDYSFRDITDYVGFRIVTLYDDDLIRAIDYVVEIVKAGQALSDPLFDQGNIWSSFYDANFNARTEVKYNPAISEEQQKDIYYKCHAYLTRNIKGDHAHAIASLKRTLDLVRRSKQSKDDKDTQIAELTAQIALLNGNLDRVCAACKPNERGEGRYSSAHLTFWANSYQTDPDESGPRNRDTIKQAVPVEFQIRTAAEDIWAEINHKLIYKSKSFYVWSLEYESVFNNSIKASQGIKSATDQLLQDVGAFRDLSEKGQNIVNDFWGDQALARERQSKYHFSLCIALIDLAGDCRTPPFIERELDRYMGLIEGVDDLANAPKAIEAISESIVILSQLADRIEVEERNVKDNDMKRLQFHRRKLAELEVLRLKICLPLYFGHRYDEATQAAKPVEHGANESLCIQLYQRLCEFVDMKGLAVRPTTMLHTWKYFLAANFDAKLAISNLESAYEMLRADNDKTIPPWSIYRVIVPYLMSESLRDEAAKLVDVIKLGGASVDAMPRLKTELRESYRSALRLAIDAFEEHTDKQKASLNRRGDIVFDRDRYRAIKHANQILRIVAEAKDNVSGFIAENMRPLCERITKAVDYMESNTKDLAYLTPDDISSGYDKRVLVKALANETLSKR